jgi:hypothetical protein
VTGRLLAALGVLVGVLLLVPAGPASACSCVSDQPAELAEHAGVAFTGVLQEQRADDDDVAHRFRVRTVHAGDVHRTQDVVTPTGGSAACGIEWDTGADMVVLGYVDEEGRVAANLCTGSVARTDPSYDTVLEALGEGAAPSPGRSVVELDRFRREDLRWFSLAIGVIGLTALAVLARRRLRSG